MLKWPILTLDRFRTRYRDALHSALMTGARLALQRGLTGREAINQILHHVQISVPDAVIGLDARNEVLGNLAKAKLKKVVEGARLDQLSKTGW